MHHGGVVVRFYLRVDGVDIIAAVHPAQAIVGGVLIVKLGKGPVLPLGGGGQLVILGGAQLVHDGAVGGQDLGPVGDDQGGIFVKAVVGQNAADGQLVWVGGRLLRGGIAQDQAASVVGGGGRHVIGGTVQGHVVDVGLLRVGQNVLHVLFPCGLTPQGQGVLVVHVGLGNGLEGVVQDDHAAYVFGVDKLL